MNVDTLAKQAFQNQCYSPKIAEWAISWLQKELENNPDNPKIRQTWEDWMRAEMKCTSPGVVGPARWNEARQAKHRATATKKRQAFEKACQTPPPTPAAAPKREETRQGKQEIGQIQAAWEKYGLTAEMKFGDTTVYLDKDGYIQVVFPKRPDDDMMNTLKAAAFKWAPSRKAWVRKYTLNALATWIVRIMPKL